jgi:hypothetical protein
MKLLRIALLLVALFILTLGTVGLYSAARDRQQVSLTCEQFVEAPPPSRWLRVSGCEVDYNPGYREKGGRISELFLPVRPRGQDKTEPAALIVATRDPEVLTIAQDTIGSGQSPSQEAFLVMMLRVLTVLKSAREVEGYARGGVIESIRTRRALGALKAPLAPEFTVLDLHARPSFLAPAVEAAAGAALLVLSLVVTSRRSRQEQAVPADEPSLLAAAVTDSEIQIDDVRDGTSRLSDAGMPAAAAQVGDARTRPFPAVMFLNLPADAGTAGIEHAPPLGRRVDVVERIAHTIGAVKFEPDGRGVLSEQEWSLTLGLGADDIVWTVTAHARGIGAVGVLDALARGTGWRIFIPKLGRFVEPGQLEPLDQF